MRCRPEAPQALERVMNLEQGSGPVEMQDKAPWERTPIEWGVSIGRYSSCLTVCDTLARDAGHRPPQQPVHPHRSTTSPFGEYRSTSLAVVTYTSPPRSVVMPTDCCTSALKGSPFHDRRTRPDGERARARFRPRSTTYTPPVLLTVTFDGQCKRSWP